TKTRRGADRGQRLARLPSGLHYPCAIEAERGRIRYCVPGTTPELPDRPRLSTLRYAATRDSGPALALVRKPHEIRDFTDHGRPDPNRPDRRRRRRYSTDWRQLF